jgi:hypothetical protein
MDRAAHRAQSVAFLRSTGLIPMELNADKSPRGGFNLLEIDKMDKGGALERITRSNDLNFGALFFDRYVDVDVDSFDPLLTAALDYMLPPTSMIWGRKSKPRSHRVYVLTEAFTRGPYIQQLEAMERLVVGDASYQVEIRGGTVRNGMYTVLPGSFIDMGKDRNLEKGYKKDGELIEWAGKFDPSASGAVVEPKQLIDKIRMAQAAALIAP